MTTTLPKTPSLTPFQRVDLLVAFTKFLNKAPLNLNADQYEPFLEEQVQKINPVLSSTLIKQEATWAGSFFHNGGWEHHPVQQKLPDSYRFAGIMQINPGVGYQWAFVADLRTKLPQIFSNEQLTMTLRDEKTPVVKPVDNLRKKPHPVLVAA